MEIKKVYSKELFKNILQSQKITESLMQEILSKVCPLHGLHANIEIKKDWEITTVTCCEDFNSLMNSIISDFVNTH